MKRLLWISLVVLILEGCGGGGVKIVTPEDGQTFQLGRFAAFQVTLDGNNYDGTTIEFRGQESLAGQVLCQNANGSAAQVSPAFGGPGGAPVGGGGAQCQANSPCTVVIIATKGDSKDIRTIKFTR